MGVYSSCADEKAFSTCVEHLSEKMKDAIANYVKGSFEEIRKVTWPTKNQAVLLSAIVIVFCLIAAAFLGVLDFLFNEVFNYLLSIA